MNNIVFRLTNLQIRTQTVLIAVILVGKTVIMVSRQLLDLSFMLINTENERFSRTGIRINFLKNRIDGTPSVSCPSAL